MKKIMVLFVLTFVTGIYAQEKGSIRGTISDLEDFNEPLLMANVQIKGTDFKTTTNFRGDFEITDIDTGSYTLVVSFLGYETLEFTLEVEKNEIIQVQESLKAQSVDLGEITSLLSDSTEFESPVASNERENKNKY